MALVIACAATAQENLDSGKTPAELYASDCAICHKSPRGLARSGGIKEVRSFLREHYTASREAAAAIAGYLQAVDRGLPPARPVKHTAKPKEKSKTDEAKPAASAKGAEPEGSEPEQLKPRTARTEAGSKPDKPVEAKADAEKTPAKSPRAAKPDSDKKSD